MVPLLQESYLLNISVTRKPCFGFVGTCFFVYNHSESCLLDLLVLCHNLFIFDYQLPNFLPCSGKEYFSFNRENFCLSFELSILQFYFQMQYFHIIYTFCLHFFAFLAITFETYNNCDSKTKLLFTLYEKF